MSEKFFHQAKIFNSSNNKLIYISKPYSDRDELCRELRDNLDVIGKRISDMDDDCRYLGDVGYKEGMEFNDHEERWDFNRKTLSEWIECGIAGGGTYGPIVEMQIAKKPLLDRYISQQSQSVGAQNEIAK